MFHRFDDSIYLYYKINALFCGNNIELIGLFELRRDFLLYSLIIQ